MQEAVRQMSYCAPTTGGEETGVLYPRCGGRGMTFYEVLAQILELLQREGRVSYRALKRQFHLDDESLEDVKAELIQAKKLARDEEGTVLVWTGGASIPPEVSASTSPHQEAPLAAPPP